jgi:hypothetical protein
VVAVVRAKKGEGGLKLLVVDASGKFGKKTVSTIKFKIAKEDPFTTIVKQGKIKET